MDGVRMRSWRTDKGRGVVVEAAMTAEGVRERVAGAASEAGPFAGTGGEIRRKSLRKQVTWVRAMSWSSTFTIPSRL